MKIITWNVAGRKDPWKWLVESDADIALLQEAKPPPPEFATRVEVDEAPWRTGGTANRPWRTAVVRLSDRVSIRWFEPRSIEDASVGELAVSRAGTIAAASVTGQDGFETTFISMYAVWEQPHASAKRRWIFADASAHRLVSDISVFVGRPDRHRIVAAGDLNVLYGYGEGGNEYWGRRYDSLFQRMAAVGLPFVGPQAPNGRCAQPWPAELPTSSRNVPTYHTKQQTPVTAARQLDFVFASSDLTDSLTVRAVNAVEEWGPSDHCRVAIDLKES